MTTTFLNIKIGEAEKKMPDTSGLVTTTALNTNIGEVKNEIPNHDAYIITQKSTKLTCRKF